MSVPTGGKLQEALVTASELGAPYTASSAGSDSPSVVTGCPAFAHLLNATSGSSGPSADGEFSAGQDGPFLIEILAAQPAAQMKGTYGTVASDLASCHNLSFTSDGTTLAFILSPIKFAAGATAARLDGQLSGIEVNGYLAVQRLEPTVALVYFFIQLESGSSQAAYAFYSDAVSQAKSVLAS